MTERLILTARRKKLEPYCSADSGPALQVKSTLSGKDWLWVGDRFLGSSRVAFEVPAAASSILSSVSAALCCLPYAVSLLCSGGVSGEERRDQRVRSVFPVVVFTVGSGSSGDKQQAGPVV